MVSLAPLLLLVSLFFGAETSSLTETLQEADTCDIGWMSDDVRKFCGIDKDSIVNLTCSQLWGKVKPECYATGGGAVIIVGIIIAILCYLGYRVYKKRHHTHSTEGETAPLLRETSVNSTTGETFSEIVRSSATGTAIMSQSQVPEVVVVPAKSGSRERERSKVMQPPEPKPGPKPGPGSLGSGSGPKPEPKPGPGSLGSGSGPKPGPGSAAGSLDQSPGPGSLEGSLGSGSKQSRSLEGSLGSGSKQSRSLEGSLGSGSKQSRSLEGSLGSGSEPKPGPEAEAEAEAEARARAKAKAEAKAAEKKRKKDRLEQEEEERSKSKNSVVDFVERHNDKYTSPPKEMKDLGSRLQRYYFRTTMNPTKLKMLITLAPISKNCALEFPGDLDIINQKILPFLNQHPCIHGFEEIRRVSDTHVIVIQQMASRGSLRDLLYDDIYYNDWSKKYCGKREVLMAKDIALYGTQILEGMMFLYKQGFPRLSHIHPGNIFMSDSRAGCTVGGYDNTLLGYRPAIYRQLDETTLPHVDAIMFGRVLFEMASPVDLDDVAPRQDELDTVASNDVRTVLEDIFVRNEEGDLIRIPSIEEIFLFSFFQHSPYPVAKWSNLKEDPKVKDVLHREQLSRKTPKMIIAQKLQDIRQELKLIPGQDLPQISWRQDKYWEITPDGDSLRSFAESSDNCPITLTKSAVKTMNEFFEACSKCPHLHTVHEVEFCDDYLVITQPLRPASLKDKIFKTVPSLTWCEKDIKPGHHLTLDIIFYYSKQILKGLRTLYRAGFPALGHVQTGNIFVEGDHCQLGGYENALLGYRTQHYARFADHMDSIDVLMFGHVVYEMASGKELTSLSPTQQDYENIPFNDVREFLRFVFEQDGGGRFVRNIEEICEHKFINITGQVDELPVSEDMSVLFKKVIKGKPRKTTMFNKLKSNASKEIKKRVKKIKEKVGPNQDMKTSGDTS